MIEVTISGIEELKKTLQKLRYIGRITGKWMNSGEPNEIMQRSFLKNFKLQGRPRWLPLSEVTIKDRDYKGYEEGPILQRSGELMDEITKLKGTTKVSNNYSEITWGVKELPFKVRQKFASNQSGKGRPGQKLPMRPMIGFQKNDGKELATSLANWILKSIT